MKFTDGQWLTKAKHTFLHPMECFDGKFIDGELILYIYTKAIQGRGQTLDQGTITLHLTTEQLDTIQVQINHYEGIRKRTPEFSCYRDSSAEAEYAEDETSYHYRSGNLEAVIEKAPFKIIYFYKGRKLTTSESKAIANITNHRDEVYMREQLSLSVGEYVYGLGERFTPFVKNGQTVDMWNEDGGTASELAYKNIPFYITNRNYGVFVKHTEKVSFEVASEQVERVQFSIKGQQLTYVIMGGTTMGQVIQNYTKLTGKPALPPAWTFGLWLSTSFTTDYNEATIQHFMDGMSERKLPFHVFHFDCFWMKASEWCNFTWDSSTFPDPKGMLWRLKERGLKICVWINPYIAQKSKLFHEGMEHHYLVENTHGDVWQWDRWQAGMGLVDFTNKEAWSWYQNQLKQLLDMGVDCFKTDFGERIPVDVVYHDGSDSVKMHNYYTLLYNRCVFELLEREKGKGEAVLFARSSTAGGQQYPIHWGGDCWGTYESMAESLRGGLSLCMSGFGFWSHDISGFENTAPPDIYKRWTAFGLLSTHSRLHGSSSYRVPWLFDEESVDVLRFFTELRCRLMPYLWSQAVETSSTGYPMLRSMIMEFDDPACPFLDNQYMLGEKLMVAPIFNELGTVQYYLPKGKWIDLLNDEYREGGRYYEGRYDYFGLPLFQKPNTILPISENRNDVVYDYADHVTLYITPMEENVTISCAVYNSAADIELKVTAERIGDSYQIRRLKGNKPYYLFFKGLDKAEEIINGTAEIIESGVLITPYEGMDAVTLKV